MSAPSKRRRRLQLRSARAGGTCACAGLRQQKVELAVGRAAAPPEVELARPPSPPNAMVHQMMMYLNVFDSVLDSGDEEEEPTRRELVARLAAATEEANTLREERDAARAEAARALQASQQLREELDAAVAWLTRALHAPQQQLENPRPVARELDIPRPAARGPPDEFLTSSDKDQRPRPGRAAVSRRL